jgi:quercetin dioxygenase-like cupin family protein
MARTVVLENDRVRLVQYTTAVGESSDLHKHSDSIIFPTTEGKFRITTAGGESKELEIKAGQPFFLDATEHSSVNIGEAEAIGFVAELK